MITVIETMMGGSNHLMVNSSLVKILADKKGADCVTLYGDRDQFNKIKEGARLEGIRFRKIKIQGNPKLYFLPFFIVYHFLLLTRLLWKARVEKDLIVVSCIFPVTHLAFKVIKKLFPRKKLVIVLHGEVEFIKDDKKPILRLLGKFLKKALHISCDANTRYLVFGQSIKKNMLVENLVLSENIMAVDHPYRYDIHLGVAKQKESKIVLGAAGVASLQKNSQLIFSLAAEVKEYLQPGLAEFRIIGTLAPEMAAFTNNLVRFREKAGFMEQAEYERQVLTLDYLFFFYDNNYYKFTASGAFFDAIRFEKPVIALRNDFIDYYFEKLGNIGYLCNDLEEMREVVLKIAKGEEKETYIIQKQMLKKAKETLSIEHIGADFWNQMEALYS